MNHYSEGSKDSRGFYQTPEIPAMGVVCPGDQEGGGPRNNELTQSSYPGFERDVFKTVADYFVNLPEPLLTFELYELFVNILGLLQPQLERIAIEALQICCLFLPPPNRRKLQLLMRMISRISQNVDMPQLHEAMGIRML
eukprot:g45462.t1